MAGTPTFWDMLNPFTAINTIGENFEALTGASSVRTNQEAVALSDKYNQLNYDEQVRANNENFRLQQENLDWQKHMYQNQMAREDTSVMRRAQDLRNAGMSPILAAGGGATAQAAPVTMAAQREAPQMGMEGVSSRQALADAQRAKGAQLAQLINQVSMSAAEIDRLHATNKYVNAQTRTENANADTAESNARVAEATESNRIQQSGTELSLTQEQINKAKADIASINAQTQGTITATQQRQLDMEYQRSMQGKPQSQITDAEKSAVGLGLKVGSWQYKAYIIAYNTGSTIVNVVGRLIKK